MNRNTVWSKLRVDHNIDISKSQLLKLVIDHGDVCDICECVAVPYICIDHDHKTGFIRGFVCIGCNIRIERQLDEPKIAAYLRREPVYTKKFDIPLHSSIGTSCNFFI